MQSSMIATTNTQKTLPQHLIISLTSKTLLKSKLSKVIQVFLKNMERLYKYFMHCTNCTNL